MPIDPNEFPPIPGEEKEYTEARRNAVRRWDIGQTKLKGQYNYGDTDYASTEELLTLSEQIFELWGRLDEEREKGEVISNGHAGLVLQKIEAALAISNDPDLLETRREFLASYPEAGVKK